MKQTLKLSVVALSLALTACSSSDDDDDPVVEEPVVTPEPQPEPVVQGEIMGPFATGSSAEPVRVYFDLDTNSVVELTAEEAATNDVWDVAFERYRVFLNSNNADNPVSAYNLNNNAEFYDAEGNVAADLITAATADSELQEYLDVTTAAIPADDTMFVNDVTEKTLTDFYVYDFTTHTVSAAPENFFIVSNNETYTKFSVTNLTQDGFVAADMTITAAYDFGESVEILLDGAAICDGTATHAYVDFATGSAVAADAAHDLTVLCGTGGFEFELDLVDGAVAYKDFANEINDAETADIYAGYGYFTANEYTELAFADITHGSFDSTWVYGAAGGHTLWSDYNIYLIKTADKHFKLQFISYYDESGVSGSISFRADEVLAE